MLLEKIKVHSGKIMFFGINMLLIVIGVMYLKQQDLEKALSEKRQPLVADIENSYQEKIIADRRQKADSVANNSGVVTGEKTVPVTKVVPGETRTVTVPVTTPTTTTSKTPSTSKSTSTSTKTS